MRSKLTIFALILISINLILPNYSNAQSGNPVTGKVTDENSDPLIGATVNIKGSNVSTATNNSGEYSIRVPNKQAILVFSYVGLTAQEIEVGNRNTINLRLLLDSKDMGEVVITALNIKKNPKSLGYSVVQLD